MRIMWIVNIIFPYPAQKMGIKTNVYGGWLKGLARSIKEIKKVELAIACAYNGNELLEFNDGNIQYYLIPGKSSTKYDVKVEEYWKKVNNMFHPDLVHIHGTEYIYGLEFLNALPNVKNVVSIQGLIYRYEDVYLGNISKKDIIENITLKDILKRNSLFQQKKEFYKRGMYEKKMIKKANAIIGRTTWDYANCKAINKNIKYYKCNETLRDIFYKDKWDIEKVEKHTLFCSQAIYPIKGFHYLLQALAILKEKYNDVKLYVAGVNILKNNTMKEKLKKSGYSKYIEKLVKKYKLENNIVFTGELNENEMVERLLKTNVFVLPSAIENSSNSLGEAMLLGMPCVASNTGGTMDMLEHNNEGFLYPYTEPAMCAEYVSRIFDNNNLAIQFGKEARRVAKQRHDPQENVKNTIQIYEQLIN